MIDDILLFLLVDNQFNAQSFPVYILVFPTKRLKYC